MKTTQWKREKKIVKTFWIHGNNDGTWMAEENITSRKNYEDDKGPTDKVETDFKASLVCKCI